MNKVTDNIDRTFCDRLQARQTKEACNALLQFTVDAEWNSFEDRGIPKHHSTHPANRVIDYSGLYDE